MWYWIVYIWHTAKHKKLLPLMTIVDLASKTIWIKSYFCTAKSTNTRRRTLLMIWRAIILKVRPYIPIGDPNLLTISSCSERFISREESYARICRGIFEARCRTNLSAIKTIKKILSNSRWISLFIVLDNNLAYLTLLTSISYLALRIYGYNSTLCIYGRYFWWIGVLPFRI